MLYWGTSSILHTVDNALELPENISLDEIDTLYNEIVAILNTGAKLYVPSRQQHFYKFWWSEELKALKEAAITVSYTHLTLPTIYSV